MTLFSNPFTFPDKIGTLEQNLQLKVIDLKCTPFRRTDLQNFQQFLCSRHDFILATFTRRNLDICVLLLNVLFVALA